MSVIEEPWVPDPASVVELSPADFETFFRREGQAGMGWRWRQPSGAEDVAQEAMVRARRHWDRVSAYDKPGTWVRRVTHQPRPFSSRREIVLGSQGPPCVVGAAPTS